MIVYGNADITGAVFRLFWRHGIQVAFVSPHGNALLGKVQPSAAAPNLPRLQHLAANDPTFSLQRAREIVAAKIASTITAARYFQQQGKGPGAAGLMRAAAKGERRLSSCRSLDEVRGVEGAVAAAWWSFFATGVPAPWTFTARRAHPAPDPVNALLSLGYTLLLSRCQTMLASADLDPLVGFLHSVHPARPSLACDLIEPYRIPMVDRLVLEQINRRWLSSDDFQCHGTSCRLRREPLRRFVESFETHIRKAGRGASFLDQIQTQIDVLIRHIRHFHR